MKDSSSSPAWPEREPATGAHVPYSHHVTPSIVATRTWEYCSVFRLGGRTFEGFSEADRFRWVQELNTLLKGWPPAFGIWAHLVHRVVREYPQSSFPDAFSARHDAAYRAAFADRPPMINELYMTVLVRATVDPALRLLSNFEKRTSKSIEIWQSRAIEQLQDIQRKVLRSLRRYDPELLTVVNRSGVRYSEPAEFFGYLLNGNWAPVPVLPARLYRYLPRTRANFATHGEQAELRGPDWERRFVMLEIREYPEETKAGHLDDLLNSPHEFVLTQTFGAMSKSDGDKALKQQIKWLEDSGDASASQIAELKEARDDLAAGRFIMGEHHATVQVWGEDAEHTLLGAAAILGQLSGVGIVGSLVDRASIAAWRAQLPGNWRWRPRPAPITSINFLCFNPLHNYLSGKPAGNPWGPAVTMLKTQGGTPYFMNYHVSLPEVDEEGKRRLGNTSIIGVSGSGKTAMLAHCLAQSRKFGATAVVFDKDCGLMPTIRQMGGAYFRLQHGRPTGWNFLQLDPTNRNLAFMRKLTTLLAKNGDQEATLADQRDIATAVDQLVQFIDRPARRLSVLLQFLPATRAAEGQLSLRERLQRWCEGGEHGWLLDNPADLLDLEHNTLFGFDQTEILEAGAIRDAAITYLLYRTKQLIDGRRFKYVFDEVQHPLKVQAFRDMMQDESRTIRKNNGVFIFATQEPAAVLEHPEGVSLVHQSATQIFFANPRAKTSEYVEGFGLTEAEFELVKGLGEFSRQFLVKQNQQSTVATLDLSNCEESLLVFGGSLDMADLAEKAIEQRGNDPQQWLPLYLELAREAGRT